MGTPQRGRHKGSSIFVALFWPFRSYGLECDLSNGCLSGDRDTLIVISELTYKGGLTIARRSVLVLSLDDELMSRQ
ncbi:hypothetical protein PISMIDRAFT_687580 [Pisolithus microcarpus 441]|uniref:Uncharacterized protein n=1 Tax=Pisolithus microcarpus 441 TaxID=765257 RepID=A0A0C9Z4N4_9AGAM|nr:hypothetical protein PISMIDRAFT_687580 [Pisolithus microcarpus 441]